MLPSIDSQLGALSIIVVSIVIFAVVYTVLSIIWPFLFRLTMTRALLLLLWTRCRSSRQGSICIIQKYVSCLYAIFRVSTYSLQLRHKAFLLFFFNSSSVKALQFLSFTEACSLSKTIKLIRAMQYNWNVPDFYALPSFVIALVSVHYYNKASHRDRWLAVRNLPS